LWAQIPAGAAVPGAAAPAAAAPAAAPASIWSFLCPDPAKVAACKAKFCASPLGTLVNGMLAPASAMSGGIINCCPLNAPIAADLALSSDSPAGAAAQIKADEAGAKKRREAVRYLGTVDCHYWPEAQKALINALRADRNECVRLEAAWALGRGCCCTKDTIVALSITVAGSDRDGNPSENCERVKTAAAASLSHCLACLADSVPLSLEPPPMQKELQKEGPPRIEKLPATPVSYYEQVEKLPLSDVLVVARRVLNKANASAKAAVAPDVAHSGAFNIIANAVASNGTQGGRPGNPGNMDMTAANPANAGTQQAGAGQPAGQGNAEVVSADPPRAGILSAIVHALAPTPLSEGQTENSSFKTQPFFLRKPQDEQVVIMGPPEQHGQYSPVGQPSTTPAVVIIPGPGAPATLPAAPKQTTPTTLVQTSYLATGTSPVPVTTLVVQTQIAKATLPAPSGVVQTSYLAMGTSSAPVTSAVKQPPSAYATATVPTEFPTYVRDLIFTVKNGKSCEEGLAAVFSLANSDWRTHPDVLLALAAAARQNPMLPVRVTAIRCLAGIRVNNVAVRTTLQILKSDADPTVRTEAEQALNALVFYSPSRDSSVMR